MNIIQENDARAMVRLLGSTAACPGGHQHKKRFLMDGLSDLIGADAWLWALSCRKEAGATEVHVGYLRGGFDESQFVSLLHAVDHPAVADAQRGFFEQLTASMQHATVGRSQMDPDGLVPTTGAHQHFVNADIGDLMVTAYPLDENSMSSIGMYRRLNGGEFTEREKRIAHIVLGEVPWLHMTGWPEDRGASVPQLFPRQRVVLNLLLDGLGRKQIAYNLEITENTVAGYVKDLYRHFGVRSQPELMNKFLSGQSFGV